MFHLIIDRNYLIQHLAEFVGEYRYSEYPFLFLQDERVLAKGEIVFEADGSVEIKMVESLEPRRGHGRAFIEYLKALPEVTEIWGEALGDAVPFWSKVGAVFEKQAFECFIETNDSEEGNLIPFTIAC